MVWSDYRNYDASASDCYAQRVLANGQIATGWPVDGVPLRQAISFELHTAAVADGSGGALVAIETLRGGGEYDVYAQHVTSSGAIAPGWDADGLPIVTLPEPQYEPVAVSDGKGGMIVAWDDCRILTGISCNLYAQRVGRDYPTPTTVSLVNARAEPDRVVLTWSTGRGVSLSAQVYRRAEATAWVSLGRPRDAGDGLLVFEDRSVETGRYAYRLGYASEGGEVLTSEEWVSVPSGYVLALAGFSPNPASGNPVVAFSLASDEAARLLIVDLAGRTVALRDLRGFGRGSQRIKVDAKLSPGAYWLMLTQGGKSLVTKGLVLR